jgi:hypothetical protein
MIELEIADHAEQDTNVAIVAVRTNFIRRNEQSWLRRLVGQSTATIVQDAQNNEDRHDHGSAKQEIIEEAFDRGKTHIPDVEHEFVQAVDDIERRPAEGAHHNADQERDNDELQRHPERRIAKKSRDCRHGFPAVYAPRRYAL